MIIPELHEQFIDNRALGLSSCRSDHFPRKDNCVLGKKRVGIPVEKIERKLKKSHKETKTKSSTNHKIVCHRHYCVFFDFNTITESKATNMSSTKQHQKHVNIKRSDHDHVHCHC